MQAVGIHEPPRALLELFSDLWTLEQVAAFTQFDGSEIGVFSSNGFGLITTEEDGLRKVAKASLSFLPFERVTLEIEGTYPGLRKIETFTTTLTAKVDLLDGPNNEPKP